MNRFVKALPVVFFIFSSILAANTFSKDADSISTLLESISRKDVDTIQGYYFNPRPFNPFCPSTFLHFYIPVEKKVRITLKDNLKAREYTILDTLLQKGFYVVYWDVSKLNSGWYLCEFTTEDFLKSENYAIVK
jgi:hypothetical protein